MRRPTRRPLAAALALPLAACATTSAPRATLPAAAAAARPAPPRAAAPDAATEYRGELAAGDPVNAQGRFEDAYTVTLAAGERCRVDLASGAFDTFLAVRPPSGAVIENDDAAQGNLNSRVEFTARAPGEYRVFATSYAPRETGAYTVTVRRGTAVPAPPPATGPVIEPAAAPLAGALEAADAQGEGGRYQDEYQFQGRRGDLVTVDLASGAFDTLLTVRSPAGDTWVSDDVTGADTNSRVQATLPADGAYSVRVSSYGPGATGGYTVRLQRSAPPARAAAGATGPVRGVAGRAGTGAVYGIFVGIRDYGGEAGNLPHCDEDASELARAMRDAGLQAAQQQVVLTNADATVANVRRAFATMAERVTADDVLVFFYSGHGSQVRGLVSPTEPDGLDETIRLRGGAMRDDDLAAMTAGMRGTVLVAMDSCYSGGFARDVVAGPNRVGVFSSEEDTLSNVAERYNAGGYLSYWLRLGVAGAADADTDGTLRVGELVDYLYAQFGAHRGETVTTGNGGGVTFQNLVVARGSVVNTDLLVRYPR